TKGWPAPHSSIWIAMASAKTSRPQPWADDMGVRNRPSADLTPNPSAPIRHPHARITAGVRQLADRVSAIERSGPRRCKPLHRLLDDRQVDERGGDAEEHREPPHDVVGTGALEQESAEPHAEEA